MLVQDFYYELPSEYIAQEPVEPRDSSHLMVLKTSKGQLGHYHFYELPEILHPDDLLVFNDTRVIPARLFGEKLPYGGRAEILLLQEIETDLWEVLVKPGKRIQKGQEIVFAKGKLYGTVVQYTNYGGRVMKFTAPEPVKEVIHKIGQIPLPPYIHHELSDKERYQTIYAREEGSAAAPTAGLHFTTPLLERLQQKGVKMVFVTLHVGLDTFRPIKTVTLEEHHMHAEFCSIPEKEAKIINQAKEEGKRIIAVGTTVARTLESFALADHRVAGGSKWTNIFIYPGVPFQIVDAMITNFHLPCSSLLMMVSAFAGKENIMKAYQEAIRQKYRFFSFGDAMLIEH